MKVERNTRPDAVEVHLEELDAHSWLRAVPDTVTEPYGGGQFRFIVVATAGASDHRLKDHLATSVSFPALLLQDPDGPTQPDAWLDVARQRLTDLDAELLRHGWQRQGQRGRHWWSLAYDAVPNPAGPAETQGALLEEAAG